MINPIKLSAPAREYLGESIKKIRRLYRTFLKVCPNKNGGDAKPFLLQAREILERLGDSRNYLRSYDRKFALETREILLTPLELAIKSLGDGEWLKAYEIIETSVNDTLSVESLIWGWHEELGASLS